MFSKKTLVWSKYPNFKPEEFLCRHTGKAGIHYKLMENLQALRTDLDFPFVITSGYRSPEHPVEIIKPEPGVHSKGLAVDILCQREQAYKIITNAGNYGFTGIGVNQKGNNRFIHLDIATEVDEEQRPTVWSY